MLLRDIRYDVTFEFLHDILIFHMTFEGITDLRKIVTVHLYANNQQATKHTDTIVRR